MQKKMPFPTGRRSSRTVGANSGRSRKSLQSTTPLDGNANETEHAGCFAIFELRQAHVCGAGDWANGLDLSVDNFRKASLSFSHPRHRSDLINTHSVQSILCVTTGIVRPCFVKMQIPVPSLLQLLILLGNTSGGSRTIAILHTTYRLTMRLVSSHISPAQSPCCACCGHGARTMTLRKQLFVVSSELKKQQKNYEASAAHGLRWTRGSRGGSLTGALHSMPAGASSAKKKKPLAQEEFHDEGIPILFGRLPRPHWSHHQCSALSAPDPLLAKKRVQTP